MKPKTTTETRRVFMTTRAEHYHADSEVSEEITMLSGKGKYWQVSVPVPFVRGIVRKHYDCDCGSKFKSYEAYELHYRRAYKEEKMVATEQPR